MHLREKMDNNTKKNLSLFAFFIVTFYCMIANFWILLAGITLMLFIDNLMDSLKEWFDKRQETYLDAIKKMQPQPLENTEKMAIFQHSISNIEKRVDALEKNNK